MVLSGGGLYGAYQAGAWKAIHPRFDPDIVVGASAGSMNAWAIAGGASPDELIGHWLALKLRTIMQFPAHLQDNFAAYRPRKECGVAMCRLPFLKRVLVTGDQVTARHILASCAVPGIFPPVRIDGGWYVDGGLTTALPVWAAIRMGATDILGVNVWQPPWRGLVRRRNRSLPDGVRLRLIQSPKPLGPLQYACIHHPDKIRQWIGQGEQDALAVLSSTLNR